MQRKLILIAVILATGVLFSGSAYALCVCHTTVHEDNCMNRCQHCCDSTGEEIGDPQELILDLDALTKAGYTLKIKYPEELEAIEFGKCNYVDPKTGLAVTDPSKMRAGCRGGSRLSPAKLPSKK